MRTFLGTLSRAHNLLAQRLEQTIVETGLSASELLVMQQLLSDGEVPTSSLLVRTGLRASTLSSLLTRLERRGYLRRRHGGRDGRSRIVSMTRPGEQAARIATSLLLELEQKLGEPRQRMDELELLDRLGRAISLLDPPEIDPADGLPIATA